jgi:hypothetical protein
LPQPCLWITLIEHFLSVEKLLKIKRHIRVLWYLWCIINYPVHNINRHCLQDRTFRATFFLKKFCQIGSSVHFFGFCDKFLQRKVFSLVSNPQPGGPCPCTHVPQWQGGPVIPPGTGFPFQFFYFAFLILQAYGVFICARL